MNVGASVILHITDEQVAQHLMVMPMMQRLDAFEGRQKHNHMQGQSAELENVSKALTDEILERLPIEDDVAEIGPIAKIVKSTEVSVHT